MEQKSIRSYDQKWQKNASKLPQWDPAFRPVQWFYTFDREPGNSGGGSGLSVMYNLHVYEIPRLCRVYLYMHTSSLRIDKKKDTSTGFTFLHLGTLQLESAKEEEEIETERVAKEKKETRPTVQLMI